MKDLPLTTKDEAAGKKWQKYIEKNQDEYGFGVIEVVSKLGANLDKGMSPAEAEKLAIKGSGITGFMAGMMADIIFKLHPRGQEFQLYWNHQFGVDTNFKGTVNPALVEIG